MHRRAFFIAVLMAAAGAVLLVLYLRRYEQEASGGVRISVVVAVKPIDRGKPLTDDMLTVRDVPQAYVEDRMIKASEKAKVLGLRLATPVQTDETLMWTDLVIASDEQRDLSSLVQPGNRAVTVRLAADDSSVSLIRPGDYVDVLGVLPQGGNDSRTAVVLLQRVLVLAMGLETSNDARITDPQTRQTIRAPLLTLSVNLQEAQLLALGAEKGRLSVALRNPDDQRVADRVPDLPSSALVDTNIRGAVQSIRKNGPVELKSQGGNP